LNILYYIFLYDIGVFLVKSPIFLNLLFSLCKSFFPLDKLWNIVHNKNMKKIRRSSVYTKWLKKLRDQRARSLIFKRTKRLAAGNPGDVEPVGDNISELRIHYGPGYRIYYNDTDKEIIILLCGGDKSTQQADIIKAKKIAKLYEEE